MSGKARGTTTGVGQSLGNAIRNDRFKKVGHKMPEYMSEKDIPKNAHLVPDWEDLEEEVAKRKKEQMTSIIDENDLDGLMRMAELADRDFTAEKQGAKVVMGGPIAVSELRTNIPEEMKKLPIPTRPPWTKQMRKETVDANERESFVNWRRGLAQLEEKYEVEMTPFEKNLEFWRQLWRVVEKSDVIVQVVDARNPLLYRSEALEEYVKQVGAWKENVLLFNKADLLPTRARLIWAKHLDELGVRHYFFAAKKEIELRVKASRDSAIPEGEEWEGGGEEEEGAAARADEGEFTAEELERAKVMDAEALLDVLEELGEKCADASGRERGQAEEDDVSSVMSGVSKSSSRLQREYIMIGFVGYPNVGKSSTMNALLGQKKVGVTSTPGKTKHFQTMIVSQDMMLCDCPGLVFPSVVASRAEMVCGGILPLNTLRDYIQPMELVARRIPRVVFEETYNIVLPSKTPSGQIRNFVTWTELCEGYAVSRGMLSGQSGVPDTHTAATRLLKDYVHGKLRFCHMPPGLDAVALGPVSAEDCTTPEQEAANAAAAKSRDVAVVAGAEGEAGREVGVAVGQSKARQKGRENRGLSAGAFAGEGEEALLGEGAASVGVRQAGGGKKRGKGKKDFVRVERPFSLVPVRGPGQ